MSNYVDPLQENESLSTSIEVGTMKSLGTPTYPCSPLNCKSVLYYQTL